MLFVAMTKQYLETSRKKYDQKNMTLNEFIIYQQKKSL